MTFKQFIHFTNDAGGLEKILRLLQSLSQILGAWSLRAEDQFYWLFLRKQFALGRRFFRFFKFLDCYYKACTFFYEREGLGALLLTGKWSCMGMYLMLESVTILDAIGVWPTPWAENCMLEANRFWFYSLFFSILLGGIQSYRDLVLEEPSKEKDKKTAARKPTGQAKDDGSPKAVQRRLVSDCFDLLIPGHVTGWIKTSPATVGFASVVSTLLSSKDIWDRLR